MEPNPNITLELTPTEVVTMQNILMEVPAKFAIPLLKKINDAKGQN
jgi:hypothetical protein